MNYVMHDCKNKQCNNGWIDKDLTQVKTFPPSWKYCKKCCEKLGIDFDKQTPTSNLSEEEIEQRNIKIKRLKDSRLKN